MIFKKKNETTKVKETKSKKSSTKDTKPKKELRGILKFLAKIGSFFGKIFGPIGGYFKGSWHELKQVRWPNRGATWSLTGAVLLFTVIFVAIIILLDAGFDILFNLIVE